MIWLFASLALVSAIGGIWFVIRRRRRLKPPDPATAHRLLDEHSPTLHQEFFQIAAASGKPRGLRWKSCDFGPERAFLQDRTSGELLALIPVTIAFEAIPGSDMEGLPAVGNLRCGSAVFVWRDGWVATGRTILNLSPDEVLRQFASRYQPWGPLPTDASL